MCFSRAQKIRTLNKGFYCYTIRPSGAFMKKRDAELVGNKMALLEARSNIVNDLNERGFNFSVKDYAGSNVMSCFELIIKMPFSARRETKKYISNLLVKESIKILPFIGRKKVDISVAYYTVLRRMYPFRNQYKKEYQLVIDKIKSTSFKSVLSYMDKKQVFGVLSIKYCILLYKFMRCVSK